MNDNLSGQITILKSGLEGLAISLYEEMATPLKNVVKVAQEMVQGLQEAFNDGGLDALVDKTGDVMAENVTRVAQAAPELIGTAEDWSAHLYKLFWNRKKSLRQPEPLWCRNWRKR